MDSIYTDLILERVKKLCKYLFKLRVFYHIESFFYHIESFFYHIESFFLSYWEFFFHIESFFYHIERLFIILRVFLSYWELQIISFCYELWLFNSFIFDTRCHRPLIFHILNPVTSNGQNLKFLKLTPSDFKHKGIRKCSPVAKT